MNLATAKTLTKVDSVKSLANTNSLTLSELDKIDSIINTTNRKIDSLRSLGLPDTKYVRKLDSLQNRLKEKLSFNQTDSINSVVIGKLKTIQDTGDSIQLSISKRIQTLQQRIEQKLSSGDSLNIDNPLGIKSVNPLTDLNTKLPLNNLVIPDLRKTTMYRIVNA